MISLHDIAAAPSQFEWQVQGRSEKSYTFRPLLAEDVDALADFLIDKSFKHRT